MRREARATERLLRSPPGRSVVSIAPQRRVRARARRLALSLLLLSSLSPRASSRGPDAMAAALSRCDVRGVAVDVEDFVCVRVLPEREGDGFLRRKRLSPLHRHQNAAAKAPRPLPHPLPTTSRNHHLLDFTAQRTKHTPSEETSERKNTSRKQAREGEALPSRSRARGRSSTPEEQQPHQP